MCELVHHGAAVLHTSMLAHAARKAGRCGVQQHSAATSLLLVVTRVGRVMCLVEVLSVRCGAHMRTASCRLQAVHSKLHCRDITAPRARHTASPHACEHGCCTLARAAEDTACALHDAGVLQPVQCVWPHRSPRRAIQRARLRNNMQAASGGCSGGSRVPAGSWEVPQGACNNQSDRPSTCTRTAQVHRHAAQRGRRTHALRRPWRRGGAVAPPEWLQGGVRWA